MGLAGPDGAPRGSASQGQRTMVNGLDQAVDLVENIREIITLTIFQTRQGWIVRQQARSMDLAYPLTYSHEERKIRLCMRVYNLSRPCRTMGLSDDRPHPDYTAFGRRLCTQRVNSPLISQGKEIQAVILLLFSS